MDFLISKTASFVGDLKELCHDESSNPIKLARALDDATGKEWRDWESESIFNLIKFKPDSIQQIDKVLAVQVAVTNPDVFDDWALFHHCNTAFNHRRCNFDWLEQPSYIELAWTCTVLNELNKGHSFGPSVLRYLTAACANDGLIYFPWIGGEGLDICAQPWGKGWIDPELCKLVPEMKSAWNAGIFKELKPSDVDDKDPRHVQFSKIVNAQEYIRLQH
jgi:hypothetical protein